MTKKKTKTESKGASKKVAEAPVVEPHYPAVILNVKWRSYLKNEIVPDPDGNLVKAGVARPYNPDAPDLIISTSSEESIPEELHSASDELVDASKVVEPESDPDPWASLEERFEAK